MAWLEKILYVDQVAPYREHAMYAGVVNTTNTPTFIVLMSSATASDINTALTNYDVVYLEPSATSYAMGSTQIVVPDGKKLIGLGNWYAANANRATLEWSGSPATAHISMTNGWLENLRIYLSGAAHTGYPIQGTTDNNHNIYKVVVECDNNLDQPAYYGPANEIRGMRVVNCNGIYFTGRGYAHYATIEDIFVYNAPTYGIQIGSAGQRVIIRNVVVEGVTRTTDYGIYLSANSSTSERITIEDCFMYECDNGYYLYQADGYYLFNLTMARCCASSCHTGYHIRRAICSTFTDLDAWNCGESGGGSAFYFNVIQYSSVKGCIAHSTPSGGCNFFFDYAIDVTIDGCRANGGYLGYYMDGFYQSAISNCVAQGCNAGSDYCRSFAFNDVERSTISSLTSLQCNSATGIGFLLSGTHSQLVYDGLTDYESTYGVYINGSGINSCSIYNVNAYNNYVGFVADDATHYRMIISNVNVYSASNVGIHMYHMTQGVFSNFYAGESASYGIDMVTCDHSSFSNMNADNGAAHGVLFDTCTYCNVLNTQGRYNRGNGVCGTYFSYCSYCNVSGVVSSDNQYCGILIDDGYYCTVSGLALAYDDSFGILVDGGYKCVVSSASIYSTGSYGVYLTSWQYGIFKNVHTDSCITIGQYYETPLRSQFQNCMAINESTANYYGYYFNNNGTGYNQLVMCNNYNCNIDWSSTIHARWYYDHNSAFD